MQVQIHIGDVPLSAFPMSCWLNDNQHPKRLIQNIVERLGNGQTTFISNSIHALGFFANLVKATQLNANHTRIEYHYRVREVELIEHRLDGEMVKLSGFNGLPTDENLVNKFITTLNEQFSKLLEFEQQQNLNN